MTLRGRDRQGAMRLALALVALALACAPAVAHTRSETRSAWRIVGPVVHLTFTVPTTEAARLTADGSAPSEQQLGDYLSARVGAESAGHACAASGPWVSLPAAAGYRRFAWTFRCPTSDRMSVRSTAFFDLVPSHTHFAQIETDSGGFAADLITRERPSIRIEAGSGVPLQRAGFLEFVWLGVMHILTGPDHISFLLGLILISRRLRDLVFVITGFTLGHSLTLALAVTGVVRPYAQYIDALVALTIVLIGAENVVAQTKSPRPVAWTLGGLLGLMGAARIAGIGQLPALLLLGSGLFSANYLALSGRISDAARVRLVVTVVFGLIHGFGFASGLLEMRLPTDRLAELLVGFNPGVEIGQLAVVGVVLALVALASRVQVLTIPRETLAPIVSAGLIAIGLFWFVTRCYA